MFTPNARRAGLTALALSLLGVAPASSAIAQTPPTPKINTSIMNRVAPPKVKPAPKLPANVVATVDGKVITRDDVLGLFDMVHGKPLVGELVKDTVIANTARGLGVVVSESELNAAIAATKDRIVQSQFQRGTPMKYEEFALQQGITPEFLRWSVYQDQLRKDTYLKALQREIAPLSKQIRVEHILLATVPLGGEQASTPTSDADQAKKDADAKTQIDSILADIKAGKITFEDAAKKYSADSSNAKDGGLLPYAERNTFAQPFDDAAWGIKTKGDIVGPIKSQFGWHLIKLVGKGSDATPDEVKKYNADQQERLTAQSQNGKAVDAWISDLIEHANVIYNPSPVIVANPKSPMNSTHLGAGSKTASK